MNNDIYSDENEKIKPSAKFSSDGESCGNMDFRVYILERDKKYSAQNINKTGSIFINGELYYINENILKELMDNVVNITNKWEKSSEVINFKNYQVNEKYTISFDSSKTIINTTSRYS